MWKSPVSPMTTNHTAMMGPKNDATFAVPRASSRAECECCTSPDRRRVSTTCHRLSRIAASSVLSSASRAKASGGVDGATRQMSIRAGHASGEASQRVAVVAQRGGQPLAVARQRGDEVVEHHGQAALLAHRGAADDLGGGAGTALGDGRRREDEAEQDALQKRAAGVRFAGSHRGSSLRSFVNANYG